jgi:hypothetical protein
MSATQAQDSQQWVSVECRPPKYHDTNGVKGGASGGRRRVRDVAVSVRGCEMREVRRAQARGPTCVHRYVEYCRMTPITPASTKQIMNAGLAQDSNDHTRSSWDGRGGGGGRRGGRSGMGKGAQQGNAASEAQQS